MASCIRNIRTKTYENWITFLQVMINKILVCFYASQCIFATDLLFFVFERNYFRYRTCSIPQLSRTYELHCFFLLLIVRCVYLMQENYNK